MRERPRSAAHEAAASTMAYGATATAVVATILLSGALVKGTAVALAGLVLGLVSVIVMLLAITRLRRAVRERDSRRA